jgi:DNA-binding NarL/FixJ family response regulator
VPSNSTFALNVFGSRLISQKIRILIADGRAVVRHALCTLLCSHPGLEVVGEARDGEEAVRLATLHAPDVVLLDPVMPGLDGVEVVRRIVGAVSGTSVLVLTSAKGEDRLFPALNAGAVGFMFKDATAEELIDAIRQVADKQPVFSAEAARQLVRELSHNTAGEPSGEPLTLRELEVLRGVAERLSDDEIGETLGIRSRDVSDTMASIFLKLNFSRRTQAILYAMKHGIASGYEKGNPVRTALIDSLHN